MSNIFEIDGDIEDNEEEGKEGPKDSESKGAPLEGSPEPVSFDLEGKPEEDPTTGPGDGQPMEQEAENSPWYEKYLDESAEGTPSGTAKQEPAIDNIDNEEPNAVNTDLDLTVPMESHGQETDSVEDTLEDSRQYIPQVDEITDAEIEEVLAELETANLELASQQMDDTGEENQDGDGQVGKAETFDDIFPPARGRQMGVTAWVIVVLFLISLTALFYYQFYDGHQVHFTLTHKSKAGMNRIDSISNQYAEKLAELENQQRIITELREKIKELHERNHELLSDSTRLTNQPVVPSGEGPAPTPIDFGKGTYYQVQVIALQEYHPDFGETEFSFYVDREEGFSKMLIGAIRDENQAKLLYDKVRKSGFSDAFIVKKVNGKRVEYNPFAK